jgi:dTDP-4-amino-4,6-dideoxygalactose transaminase
VPYKVDAVRFIVNKYEIPILEDSAEALGSTYKGQKCGHLVILVFYPSNGNKIITISEEQRIQPAVKTKRCF